MNNIKVKPFTCGIDVIFEDGTDLFIPNTTLKSLKATSIDLTDGIKQISRKNDKFISDEN